jgi:hypothetical protein
VIKLIKYGDNLQYKIYNFEPKELYIAIANYDKTSVSIVNPINELLRISKKSNNLVSRVNFVETNKNILSAYLANKLWIPKKHHLFSNSKKHTIFTFVIITKKIQKIIKQLIPKPIIYIMVNLFIFD